MKGKYVGWLVAGCLLLVLTVATTLLLSGRRTGSPMPTATSANAPPATPGPTSRSGPSVGPPIAGGKARMYAGRDRIALIAYEDERSNSFDTITEYMHHVVFQARDGRETGDTVMLTVYKGDGIQLMAFPPDILDSLAIYQPGHGPFSAAIYLKDGRVLHASSIDDDRTTDLVRARRVSSNEMVTVYLYRVSRIVFNERK
jgi:hypothetical protein